MRAAISRKLECNGKTYWLPVPARRRELLEAGRVLEVTDDTKDEDVRTVEYRSLIGVVPEVGYNEAFVEDTAECLSRLTPNQLEAVKRICASFELVFDNVYSLIVSIGRLKGISADELMKTGIPKTEERVS